MWEIKYNKTFAKAMGLCCAKFKNEALLLPFAAIITTRYGMDGTDFMSKIEYGGQQVCQHLCSSQSEDVQQTSFTDINFRSFIACNAVNYVGGRARKIMPDGLIGFRGSNDCGGIEERTCMCSSGNDRKKIDPAGSEVDLFQT